MIDPHFEVALDAYQEKMSEMAEDAAARSYQIAARPNAVPAWTTFSDLRPGDFMTNEGPSGRWVEVIQVNRGPAMNVRRREPARKPAEGEVSVKFRIPEPVTVNMETDFWVERPEDEQVLIDQRNRDTP